MGPLFLVALLPPDVEPPPYPGQRIRWPDESQEFTWDGKGWVCEEEDHWVQEW